MASQRSATAILYFITLFSVIVVTNFAYKCESRHLGQIKVAQDNGFKEMVASAPMEESGEKILPIPSPLHFHLSLHHLLHKYKLFITCISSEFDTNQL